ncbi:U1 zinc finger containing protein, putative [Angomonas deanei]|uniref:U1 zinc finger containing protein, putative n=1 Tax=Angomonas deanei TaxID=59799 RepID=A0A7G2CPI4_9TRYP|nr:U1 zinc finger containing protein, putative [Angomonas deanei]
MSHHSKLDEVHLTSEDLIRQKKRKRMAKMSPEKRRKFIQYERRHNEKDGNLIYCDYCDVFISSKPRVWNAHRSSRRHMDNFEAYYAMVAGVEPLLLREINEKVQRARNRSQVAVNIGQGITVGHKEVTVKVGNNVVYNPSGDAQK